MQGFAEKAAGNQSGSFDKMLSASFWLSSTLKKALYFGASSIL